MLYITSYALQERLVLPPCRFPDGMTAVLYESQGLFQQAKTSYEAVSDAVACVRVTQWQVSE